MNYRLNACRPVSFDDDDITNYLDDYIVLPNEPTDKVALDDEAKKLSMDFIENYLFFMEIDEEATADSRAFRSLVLRMESYIFLKRHAPWLYKKIKNNL